MTAATDPAQRLARATANWNDACDDLTARTRLAISLYRNADQASAVHRTAIETLVRDPRIDPVQFERAGWVALADSMPDPTDPEASAHWLERDSVAQALLEQMQVAEPAAERILSAIRRWLLIGERAAAFPRAAAALIAQAAINGGCWPFDEAERAVLVPVNPLTAAYLPPRPSGHTPIGSPDTVTREVASFYTHWPYPIWQRVNALQPPLAREIAGYGPGAPDLTDARRILVAGCGTGREALRLAIRAPQAQITAIDLSETSLAYARERCGAVSNLRFVRHDLIRVADLGEQFDFIASGGVLHHMADPEAAFHTLLGVLRPGGVINVALYSRVARLAVQAARTRFADLTGRPVDDDLVREVRRRLTLDPVTGVCNSPDFFTLGGASDLLLHPHEDCFDIPRIRAMIESTRVELLHFRLPGATERAGYRARFPHDPLQRDLAAIAAFERTDLTMFAGMYIFVCVKPR
jgi:SAM-dependent methyltransferase